MSAAPKSRLGRGLGGLIASAVPPAPKTETPAPTAAPAAQPAPPPAQPAGAPGYQEVNVHAIEPSPYQARREITPEQLHALRADGSWFLGDQGLDNAVLKLLDLCRSGVESDDLHLLLLKQDVQSNLQCA